MVWVGPPGPEFPKVERWDLFEVPGLVRAWLQCAPSITPLKELLFCWELEATDDLAKRFSQDMRALFALGPRLDRATLVDSQLGRMVHDLSQVFSAGRPITNEQLHVVKDVADKVYAGFTNSTQPKGWAGRRGGPSLSLRFGLRFFLEGGPALNNPTCIASVYGGAYGATISIFKRYWGQPVFDQLTTIYHEMSHIFAQRDDGQSGVATNQASKYEAFLNMFYSS